MGRPKGFTSDMIGLAKARRPAGAPAVPLVRLRPEEPPDLRALAFDAGGVLLERSRLCRPARSLFPPGPEGDALFGRHLDELGERLRAAEPALQAAERERGGGRRAKDKKAPWWYGTASVAGLTVRLSDLPVVCCAGCRRHLLGPSREPIRGQVGPRVRSRLPPPVAGRRAGRPYCLACLPAPLDGAAG